MVRTTLVESEIENGKRIINRLDEAHLNFPVIFWMYDEDADNWKLVFSREDINKLGKRYFYQKLIEVLSKDHLDEGITLTLIDTNNALIKALRAFISMPTIGGSWFTGNSINGRMFPDAYLYRVA
jgi:hypothetical protein